MPRGGAFAAVEQGQFDVFLSGSARQQVEALEHEAQVVPPQQRALRTRQAFHVLAEKQVGAAAGNVQAAEDVHRRRFAGTAGAHDGDEFSRRHRQIDAAQAWNAAWPWP